MASSQPTISEGLVIALIVSLLAALAAFQAAFAGVLTAALLFAAVLAFAVKFLEAYQSDAGVRIPVKTLLTFVVSAGIYGLSYLVGQPVLSASTEIAAAVLALHWLYQELPPLAPAPAAPAPQ